MASKPKPKKQQGLARFPTLKFGAPQAQPTGMGAFAQQSPQAINQTIAKYQAQLGPVQTPQQIQRQVRQYRSTLPAPISGRQIQTQAQAMLDPVIQRLTSQINQRAAAQSQALGGYTNRLVQNLAGAGDQLSAPYQQSAQATAAVAQSLADRLQSGGQQTAGDLSSRLAAINAPGATAEAAGQVSADATGAGNALYASGAIDTNELLKYAASAGGYGAKLPRIAQLEGLQQQANVRQQAAGDLATGITGLQSQLPGIVQQYRAMNEQRRSDRANAAQQLFQYLTNQAEATRTGRAQLGGDLYTTLTGQNITRGTAAAGLLGDYASAGAKVDAATTKANAPQRFNVGKGAYTYNPATNTVSTLVEPPAPEVKPPKINTAASAKYGIQVDTNGQPIRDAKGNTIPYPKTPPKPKVTKRPDGITPNKLVALRGQAQQVAQDFRNGYTVTDPTTHVETQKPPRTRGEAVAEMRRKGIPEDIIRETIAELWPLESRFEGYGGR